MHVWLGLLELFSDVSPLVQEVTGGSYLNCSKTKASAAAATEAAAAHVQEYAS
jgi:hypothetical protein